MKASIRVNYKIHVPHDVLWSLKLHFYTNSIMNKMISFFFCKIKKNWLNTIRI